MFWRSDTSYVYLRFFSRDSPKTIVGLNPSFPLRWTTIPYPGRYSGASSTGSMRQPTYPRGRVNIGMHNFPWGLHALTDVSDTV